MHGEVGRGPVGDSSIGIVGKQMHTQILDPTAACRNVTKRHTTQIVGNSDREIPSSRNLISS